MERLENEGIEIPATLFPGSRSLSIALTYYNGTLIYMLVVTREWVSAYHAAVSVSPCIVGEWWGDPVPAHSDSTPQLHSTGQAQLHQPGVQNTPPTSITERYKLPLLCTVISRK